MKLTLLLLFVTSFALAQRADGLKSGGVESHAVEKINKTTKSDTVSLTLNPIRAKRLTDAYQVFLKLREDLFEAELNGMNHPKEDVIWSGDIDFLNRKVLYIKK